MEGDFSYPIEYNGYPNILNSGIFETYWKKAKNDQ